MPLPIEEIVAIVKMQLGFTDVNPNDHLIETLGAESADVVNLAAALEEKYNVVIDESELANLSTAARLHMLIEQKLNGRR